MTETPQDTPAPGWYPDPNGSGGQRWWDGSNWSDHVAPGAAQANWGSAPQLQPGTTAGGYQYGAPPAGFDYSGYAPQSSPLTQSGMRRLQALFSDVGRILRRAWLPIVGVSLIIWLAWTALVVVAMAFVVDFGNLRLAIEKSVAIPTDYPSGNVPATVQNELTFAWESVPRTESAWPWIAIGLGAIVLTVIAAAFQTTAVNQLGIDAAAGQPARLCKALRNGLPAAFRLSGYLVTLTLLILIIGLAWGFLLVAAFQASEALGAIMAIVSFLGFLGVMVLMIWATGRLAPVLVQVLMGGGAVSWSWRATKGKFWAVLGRYLVWGFVASLVVQIVMMVLMIPAYLLVVGTAAYGSESGLAASSIFLLLLIWPATMVATSISYVGVVPIWRDLTDDPTYRSIGPDGIPVPEPSSSHN
jgi:hypothetical protein